MLNPWKEIKRLNRIIEEQAKIIANLTARLDLLENRKNSRNSSIPPSHDYSRLNIRQFFPFDRLTEFFRTVLMSPSARAPWLI